MKSEELHQQLRQMILQLPNVTERQNAGIPARPHRWAPEKGYVTFVARNENDLSPAMELIRMSHDHFAGAKNSQ